MKIEIKNLAEFKREMEEKQKKVKELLGLGVRDATLYMHSKIKESIARGTNAPVTVDTGRFLNSVDFQNLSEDSSKVYTDLEYAKYLEYGTSKMSARPHFRNTAIVEEANVTEVMGAQIGKIE